jgi:hypothetical protein
VERTNAVDTVRNQRRTPMNRLQDMLYELKLTYFFKGKRELIREICSMIKSALRPNKVK